MFNLLMVVLKPVGFGTVLVTGALFLGEWLSTVFNNSKKAKGALCQ